MSDTLSELFKNLSTYLFGQESLPVNFGGDLPTNATAKDYEKYYNSLPNDKKAQFRKAGILSLINTSFYSKADDVREDSTPVKGAITSGVFIKRYGANTEYFRFKITKGSGNNFDLQYRPLSSLKKLDFEEIDHTKFKHLFNFLDPIDFATQKKCKPGRSYPCKSACIPIYNSCRNPLEGQAKKYAAFLEIMPQAADIHVLAAPGKGKTPQPKTPPQMDFFLKLRLHANLETQDFSLAAIEGRGAHYTTELTLKLALADTIDEQVGIMQKFREDIMSGGYLSTKEAREIAQTKDIAPVLKRSAGSIQDIAAEFYELTGGMGATQLKGFGRDDKHKRAYATGASISVGKGAKSDRKRVIFHEMGHFIEFETPRIAAAASEWRDRKATGEPQLLSKLTGDEGYEEDEFAKPDHYFDPYVGKVYKEGDTEVISTGMEKFSSPMSMLDLWQKDRSHFKLIVGILKRDPEIQS